MNQAILSNEVQSFLHENPQASSVEIALKKSPFPEVSSTALASQIASRQKIQKKLPLWYNTKGIYYPVALSLEQSSSEKTAAYKTTFVEKNAQLIDLTGGFGIDTYYLSRVAKSVVHCELNEELSTIAQHNSGLLGTTNITFVNDDGLKCLKEWKASRFDLAYIDPSRRVKKRKVFHLNDCEPNIVDLQEMILHRVDQLLIKAAPLLDISAALTALKNVKEIHILSVKNECREILFLLEKDFEKAASIHAVGLGNAHDFHFSFYPEEEKKASVNYGIPEKYLFEPDAALMKSGGFKLIAERFNLRKLHQHTHLYTSKEEIKEFPGRGFKVVESQRYGAFKKTKQHWKANIISRNFPLKTKEIRKKHAIEDGGDVYLFFCTTIDGNLETICAERLF